MDKKEKTYTREMLLKSKRYAGIQKDFLAAILKNPIYKLSDADRAVREFFGKDVI